MAYDIKFKQRVLSYLDKGHSQRETANTFDVGTTTIKNWRRLLANGEGLAPKPRRRKPKKIDPVRLREIVEDKPDAYGGEIADELGCSYSAVWYALRRLGFTLKKKRRPTTNATSCCAPPSSKPSRNSRRKRSSTSTKRG
jgi:transposase